MKSVKQNPNGYKKNIIKLLSMFFVIFPWITYLKILEYSDAERAVFSSYQGYATDFFLYYKERVLILFAVFLLCWFVGERIFPDKVDNNVPLLRGKNRLLFVLSGIALSMAAVSTIFSANSKNALWGSPTDGEGLWTLCAYIVILLACYNYFANEYGMSQMKKMLLILGIVTIGLSFVEFLYKPLIEIKWLQGLIVPSEYAALMEGLSSSGSIASAVALTFFNPNYYGGFLCILLPFFFVFYIKETTAVKKACMGGLCVGLLICVVLSNSTTALYIASIEYILVSVLYVIKCAERKKAIIQNLVLLIAIVASMTIFSIASGNSIFDLAANENAFSQEEQEKVFQIKDICLKGNQVLLQGEVETLKITYVDGQIQFTNGADERVEVIYEDGEFTFKSEEYEDITIEMVLNEGSAETASQILAKIIVDAGYKDTIDFYILTDGSMAGVGQNNAILKNIQNTENYESLKPYYSLFTGRGYAWINSLPILKDTIVKGVGPGNFAYYFKQQDYVGMLNTHGSMKYIIDKPHNAYIQYATQIGVIGMLAFFAIFVLVGWKGLQTYRKDKGKPSVATEFQLAGVVAVFAFLIYSMINDSMVTVTPFACLVAGIVLAASDMSFAGGIYGKKK